MGKVFLKGMLSANGLSSGIILCNGECILDGFHSRSFINRFAGSPIDLEMQVYYNSCFDDSILADCLFGHSPQQHLVILSDNKIDFVYVSWEELDRYQASYGYDERVNRGWINELVENGLLVEDRHVEILTNQGQLFRVSN